MEEPLSPDEASAETHPDPANIPAPQPRWITALTTVPYSDVILSGSWDGAIRAWRVSDDKKKIESVGIVGTVPSTSDDSNFRAARGVVNDISVFERGDRGKDGLCIVAACGKEHRFGRYVFFFSPINPPQTVLITCRWKKIPNGRNGGVVFEVPRISAKTNGVFKHADEMES